jgi:hypothetical protein
VPRSTFTAHQARDHGRDRLLLRRLQRSIFAGAAQRAMTGPISVLRTLWTTEAIRCVLVKQLQPPVYAVQIFDGTSLVCTELVDDPQEAGEIAAALWGVFVDRTA